MNSFFLAAGVFLEGHPHPVEENEDRVICQTSGHSPVAQRAVFLSKISHHLNLISGPSIKGL